LLNPVDKTDALTGDQAAAGKLIQQVQADCKANGNTNDWCPYVYNPSNPNCAAGGPPPQEIDVWYRLKSTTRQAFSNAAAQTWSQVLCLNVQAKGFDGNGSAFYKNVRQDQFQGYAGGWLADYPDPQDWLSLQFHGGTSYVGTNYTKFVDPALDRLMDQADINTNQAARMQQYNVIEQQLVNASPEIPYNQAKAYWLQRSWVHGFGLNSLQIMPDINWPSVYILDHSSS
jgi:peptide/nickel transport system substrate-binding protein/oligopeptide transport system substrate-binding protein